MNISDALQRLDTLEEMSREISGRATGWASGANSRELREVKAEIAEIRSALDPVHAGWRDLLREMEFLADGCRNETPGRSPGGMLAFTALDELCNEGNPSVTHLRQREVYRAQVAEMASMVAKRALALATAAAAGLPEIERWRASVKLEAAE